MYVQADSALQALNLSGLALRSLPIRYDPLFTLAVKSLNQLDFVSFTLWPLLLFQGKPFEDPCEAPCTSSKSAITLV